MTTLADIRARLAAARSELAGFDQQRPGMARLIEAPLAAAAQGCREAMQALSRRREELDARDALIVADIGKRDGRGPWIEVRASSLDLRVAAARAERTAHDAAVQAVNHALKLSVENLVALSLKSNSDFEEARRVVEERIAVLTALEAKG